MNESTRLGATDLRVTRLGYGAARIDAIPADQTEVLLNALVDEGITFIDTADCYGDSEELIGRFLGRRMQECVVATKCGCLIAGEQGDDYTGPVVTNSIDRSLQRLGVDHLDLVFIHSCSAEQLRNGGCTEALLAARDAGKVRYTGYSGDGDDALEAIAMGVFDALQITFNVVNQEALAEVLPAAEQAGMGVIAKRPIANARLADAESPVHRDGSHWDAARPVLEEHGVWEDPLELSLRFILSHDVVASAIVGTTDVDHARANVRRAAAGRLPAAAMEALHRLEPRE